MADNVTIELSALDHLTGQLAEAIAAVHRFAEEAEKGLNGTKESSGGLMSKLSDLGNIVTGVKSGMDVLGGAANYVWGIFERGKHTLEEYVMMAAEVEVVDVKLAHTLKQVGDVAGYTFDQLDEMAGQMQDITRFEDEMSKGAAEALLVFKGIRGDQFKEALKLTTDLAEKMGGGGLTGAARILGRALESPGEGLRMLKRFGIEFTDTEMKMMKGMTDMGMVAEAQSMVIAKLNERIGGLAAAVGDTLTGRLARISNKFGDMREEIGGLLLPVVKEFTPLVDNVFLAFDRLLPHLERFTAWAVESGKELVASLQPAFEQVVDALFTTVAAIWTVTEEWQAAWDLLGSTVALAAVGMYEDMKMWVSEGIPKLMEYAGREMVRLMHSYLGETMIELEVWIDTLNQLATKPISQLVKEGLGDGDKLREQLRAAHAMLGDKPTAFPAITRETTELEKGLMEAVEKGSSHLTTSMSPKIDALKKSFAELFKPREQGGVGPDITPTKSSASREGDFERMLAKLPKFMIPNVEKEFKASFVGIEDLGKQIQEAAASTGGKPEDKIIRAIEVAQAAVEQALGPAGPMRALVDPIADPLMKGMEGIKNTFLQGFGLIDAPLEHTAERIDKLKDLLGKENPTAVAIETAERKKESRDKAAMDQMKEMIGPLKKMAAGVFPGVFS